VAHFLVASAQAQTALQRLSGEARGDRAAPPPTLPEQRGTTRSQFFAELFHEAGTHPALRHPLLSRLAEGTLTHRQLTAFAVQHYMYSRNLGRNLGALLSNLPDEEVRSALIANMNEELGESHPSGERIELQLLRAHRLTAAQLAAAYAELLTRDSPAEVVDILVEQGHLSAELLRDFRALAEQRMREQSRPAQLQRFLRALGLTPSELANGEPVPETAHCIDEYYQLCRSSSWQEALAAVGVGAEWLLPSLDGPLGKALARSGVIPLADGAYFTLPVEPSESRGARLVQALSPYGDAPEGRRRIAAGIRRALATRQRWYDGLEKLLARPPVP
jgi:pyrroloquinoline quinone (PQQ) biosynthesis protein C